ncbi:competence type IV pilus minor pilin ComGG [Bacillus sp. 1P06AnD]|uniref:competence type IV pilus minor pilin ComGG n=1 Tax=Bacillus sp. 1P06AnD TaxID=3132208 RepID=UPI0039A2A9A9
MERSKQRGSVYLPVLFVLGILLFLVVAESNKMLAEKRFAMEVIEKNQSDHLLWLALNDTQRMLEYPENRQSGYLYYSKGTVRYVQASIDEETIQVSLYAENQSGGRAEGAYLYSSIQGKMVQWLEK